MEHGRAEQPPEGARNGIGRTTLQSIEQAVREAAEKDADLIIKAAEMAARAQIEAAREEATRDEDRRYQAAARAIEDEAGRRLLQHKGTASKQLLEMRNELLGRVFAMARERILNWPEEQYMDVMRRRLERAAAESGGRLRVHASERDAFGRLLESFNTGRPVERQVALDDTTLRERGGFVFVAETYEVDQTVDTVLGELRYEMAPAIATELFGA